MSIYPLLTPIFLTSALMVVAQTATANRLKNEQSPYLLQHAENPVDWYPWSDEAFALAKKNHRLIFLSIGYSTCHWCHVMEHESFEDTDVARLLNRDFVSIKVDREERPDIDEFYMRVATRLTGQGGWPLTIIMTPEKVPLFAATYLPKERRHNRPGMLDLLPQIAAAWADHPEKLRQDAQEFLRQLTPGSNPQDFSPALIQQATAQMRREFDNQHGGFGQAPKFPRPHQLSFLLQRSRIEDDPQLLQMVETTLSAMRKGGIYDQIGFGFHRYSTDRHWLVPHFEKMLYDQAGLAITYLEAYSITQKPEYAATAREIFHYLSDEMRDPQGGFYSAEDADTQGVEGKTYLWEKNEFIEILGKETGERLSRFFNLTEKGNFTPEVPGEATNANIPHRSKTLNAWAEEFGVKPAVLKQELEAARTKLLLKRNARPQPMRDDKILTAWNGMLISALSLGATALQDQTLLETAEKTADFILSMLRDPQGNLLRRWRHGETAIGAFAEDYAYLSRGLLDLYHASLDPLHLQEAISLAETLFADFVSTGTVFTSADAHDLPQRTSERYEGATPSATSVALEVAARLALLSGKSKWQTAADQLLKGASAEVRRYPQGYPHLLSAAALQLEKTRELVIVGQTEDGGTKALLKVARASYQPLLSLLFVEEKNAEQMATLAPFTKGMHKINGQATAYLCENMTCGKPLTDVAELKKQLQKTMDQ